MIGFGKPLRVLLVEDNPGDAELAREALAEDGFPLDVSVAVDGVEALDRVRSSRPDIVLLDLNLPRKNGREVLAELKGDPDLKHIPVVVLSSSDAEKDVMTSYDLGASCYVTKPVDLEAFQAAVERMAGFWFGVVRFPVA